MKKGNVLSKAEMKMLWAASALALNQICHHTSVTPVAWQDTMKMSTLKNRIKKKSISVKENAN